MQQVSDGVNLKLTNSLGKVPQLVIKKSIYDLSMLNKVQQLVIKSLYNSLVLCVYHVE